MFSTRISMLFLAAMSPKFESFNAVRAHLFFAEAGDFIPGLSDHAGTFEFFHRGNEVLERFQCFFAVVGVSKGRPDAAGAVKFDAELAFLTRAAANCSFFQSLNSLTSSTAW